MGDVMSLKSGDNSHDVPSRKRKALSLIGGLGAIALASGNQGCEALLPSDLSSLAGHGNSGKRMRGMDQFDCCSGPLSPHVVVRTAQDINDQYQ